MDVTELASLRPLLSDRYGVPGTKAADNLERWLSGAVPFAFPDVLRRHLSADNAALIVDAFWQVLPFGTGGRRGRVGYGANRLNHTTLAMTIQGHCQYLLQRHRERTGLSVVVANDVRVFRDVAGAYRFLGPEHPLLGLSSRMLAKLACEIYAGNGITAYILDPDDDRALLTTPELSFLIPVLRTVGGVNVSASHNPPDDNGLKIYDEFGSQPVAPDDQMLLDIMSTVAEVRSLPFQEAKAAGLVRPIDPQLFERYLRGYEDLYAGFHIPDARVPIVYTPLCGCGLRNCGALLTRLGFPMLVPPQQGPDGAFSVIPFRAPNPEVPQATEPARAFAEQHGADIVLSSDPDADRIGLEIRLRDGSWFHFDGNQIAVMLCYALMLDPRGPRRSGLVIETLVTTKLLGRIVAARGDSDIIDDLLVGFKYVADVIKSLSAHGRYRDVQRSPSDLVLAAEESHGVVVLPTILDKDAAPACMYLAGLHQRLAAEKRTLLDYYVSILEELGPIDMVGRSIMMTGAAGMERKDRIMASLRNQPPKTIAGEAVRRVADYLDTATYGRPIVSESEILPRNVIQLFTDSLVVTIRPSGTEPKLKLYCQVLGEGLSDLRGTRLLDALRARSEAAGRLIYNDLLGLLGVSLGEPGLLLPDIIDVDRKLDFERQTVPRFLEAVRSEKFTSLEAALAWLRQEASAMLPGIDALPALKAAVLHLCSGLEKTGGGGAIVARLIGWASGRDEAAGRAG